ncbi:hypothetical protein BC830DRAFT_1238096 [Chytriomyces sp. MP71]|nr:hypothetical protein BC830DRAFT_1238096 [Chytriomyces sp. MP71]
MAPPTILSDAPVVAASTAAPSKAKHTTEAHTASASLIVSWPIQGKKVLVVGGDAVSAARAKFAVDAGANVTLVSPLNELSSDAKSVANSVSAFVDGAFDALLLSGCAMVFVSLQNAVEARQVALACKSRGVPVSVASQSDVSDFFFMSTHKDQSLQVAISTNGNGPRLASKLRKQIVKSIPPHAGAALETLSRLRQQLKAVDPSSASATRRMSFVNRVSEAWSVETLASLFADEIASLVKAYSNSSDLPKLRQGSLRIIRASSGHVDDLTVGAFRALSESQLVLADSSVSREILELTGGDVMLIPSDAETASDSVVHAAIHALEHGQNVIRLKAGNGAVSETELALFTQKGFTPIFLPFVGGSVIAAVELVDKREEEDAKEEFHEAQQTFTAARSVQAPVAVAPRPATILASSGTPKLISGQDAATHVAYSLTDMSFVYPVVPESTLGQIAVTWSTNGVKNAHGKSHKVLEMSTRSGAAAVAHGASHNGSSVSVIANSAALSHMLPSMFQIASAKLPVVMHVATQGLSREFGVYNSVADVTATSFTGFAALGSSTVKEAHDLALIAHVSASVTQTPFIHFFDGARIATEQSVVPVIDTSSLGSIVSKAISQAQAVRSIPVADLVETVMGNMASHVGHQYKLFEYVGNTSAESVIVALGASASVAEEAVRILAAAGESVGLLKIRLLRPWSARHFLAALPRTVKRVAVIDDSKVAGSTGHGPLFLDVTAAFYDSVWSLPIPTVFKGNFAVGIENVNSAAVVVFLNGLASANPKFDFKIEMPATASQVTYSDVAEAIVWDVQADGTDSVGPHVVKLLQSQGVSSVSVFTSHSSVHVEPVSATHIRFSKHGEVPATASLVNTANVALVNNISLLEHVNVAASIREDGILVINRQGANPTIQDVAKDIPAATKRTLQARRIRLAVIDADKIAFNYTLFRGNKGEYRNLALVAALTKLWDGVDAAMAVSDLEAYLTATAVENTVFRTKLGAVRTALNSIAMLDTPRDWAREEGAELAKFVSPTFGLKKLANLDQEDGESLARTVASYQPALPILFKEAFGLQSASRPDAGEKTFQVKVTENRRLTPESYERNVFHIEFDIGTSGLTYAIGEALGVYGQNNAYHVDEFLAWYGEDGAKIIRYDRINEKTSAMEVEFKTVAQLLTEVVDIFGQPGKKFYQNLIEHASVMSERERLGFLASGEGADALAQLIEEETPTFADVLQMFPSAHPSIEKLLSYIPNIKPRHYSISSSMNVHPTSVHLLVVVVDWKTKAGKSRMGQCTRYLVGLRPGKTVTVSVKPSVMKLPSSNEAPVIMAGLGTGMAPFRAFVEERAYQKALGHKVGPMVLYFGARHRAEEWLYGEELEAYHADGLLSHLRLAFSRDQKEKVYIQHKIKADDTMLGEMILKQGGAFYLCGPTWPVPDIKDALVTAFSRFMTSEEAEAKLEELKEEERYVLEVY